MKQSIFTALVFFCFVPLLAQELFFNYRTEDRPFLHYYSMWNQFDSSAVMFRFGEVHFVGTIRKNINLSLAFPDRRNLQDSGVQGVSSQFQKLARTENFTVPGAGEIRWFGQLQAFKTPCNLSGNRDEPNKPVPGWGVVDWTEFVIQLVDAQSDIVLAVLDSVGVKPTNGIGGVDTRYGTHPERVKHSALIPASYAGREVYIRISPRRWGSTPYGLAMTRFDSWFNLLAEWDETGTTQISLAGTDSLRDVWFAGLIHYCDSVKAETGWLPDLNGISFAKTKGLPFYHERYFNAQVNGPGDTAWVEKHTVPLRKRKGIGATGIAIIKSIAPNPVSGESAEVTLVSGFDTGYRLQLVASDGQKIGTLWSGSLNRGQAEVTVSVPQNLANGNYTLLLEQENGERVNQSTLVIAR